MHFVHILVVGVGVGGVGVVVGVGGVGAIVIEKNVIKYSSSYVH